MATALQKEIIYQGNKRVLGFQVRNLDADPEGNAPLDLTTLVVKWALARKAAGSYSKTPVVTKESPSSGIATAISTVSAVAVAAGGAGYTLGDILIASGGSGVPASFEVTGEVGGVVTAVTVVNPGAYSANPSSPAATTGGTGASCTLTLTLVLAQGLCLVTLIGVDTVDLLGEFYQELEVYDGSNESLVVGTGDVTIRRNVTNP